jgi:hypothetical protein
MRETVPCDRDHARIAKQHFINAPRGRVPLIGRLNIAFEQRPHLWQICGELAYDLAGLLLSGATALAERPGCKSQFSAHLFEERLQRSIETASHEVIDTFLGESRRTKMPWKKRS